MKKKDDELKVTPVEETNASEKKGEKKSVASKIGDGFYKAGLALGNWVKRIFFGASKELTDEEKFRVEKLESPGKMLVKSFFRRKLAVAALVILVSMFLFVFIGPLFCHMDINYTDALQKNIAPNYSMLSVPRALNGKIKDINGFSNFTVGVGTDKKLYVWGDTKDKMTKANLKKYPDEVKNGRVEFAAAGVDHIIAILETGKVIGWGSKSNGQYGGDAVLNAIPMPDDIVNGTLNVDDVEQLVCGYQASAIVMKDGSVYAWGNKNAVLNLQDVAEMTDVAEIQFSNAYAVVRKKDGSVTTGSRVAFTSVVSSLTGKVKGSRLADYLAGKKAVDIACSNYCLAIVLDTGELVMSGVFENGEDEIRQIPAGEKYVKVAAGTRHIIGLTDAHKAYSWGINSYGLNKTNGKENVENIYTGSLQSYFVNSQNKINGKAGLKGYIMGTDGMGRDVFTRIIYGGRMTMTIGAVAVIISTFIAIIIGCLSGYFGGKVDMILMRVTEVCSSIPFLPFAMLLSTIIRFSPIGETTRIFIIMVILGALSWPALAHMIRGQVLAEREKEFVVAAKAMGVRESKIAFRHILPNIISIILVSVTLDFAGCMLTESSLSYLGFGVQQPQPTWGNMLNGANNSIVIQNYWWQWLFPAIFLAIATICINVIGDALRDVFDPKSNSER